MTIYHLATLKTNEDVPPEQRLHEVKNRMLSEIESANYDPEFINNGFQSGWNAALEYARKVVLNGKMG